MKQLLSIVLLSVFAASIIRPVLPFLEYIIDYDYIVEVLCINKEEPELQCNGKCHLKKQLAIAAERDVPEDKRLPQVTFEKFPTLFFDTSTNESTPLTVERDHSYWDTCPSILKRITKPKTPPPKF